MRARLEGLGRLAPDLARGIHRLNSAIADALPARIISRFNRLPGADVMLIGPRTSRVVIDVQHPDRPAQTRIDVVTLRTVTEALVDEVALGLLKGNQAALARPHFQEANVHARRLAEAAEAGEIDLTPEVFCGPPEAPAAVARLGTVRSRGAEADHLAFPSGFVPPPLLPASLTWDDHPANASVHVYALELDVDAPWVVNVHGFKQGLPEDLFLFRSAATRERFGVNVVHPVLPMSGLRASAGAPQIPGTDFGANVVGFAQAVWDVRRTIRWIRSRSDAPIILHGVSLGSYVVSMVSGLEDGLAGVIAGLPVSDYPRLMRRHARRMELPDDDLALVDDPALDRLFAPVSPFSVVSKVPSDRRYIYAGKIDQISSTQQALDLWEHWGSGSIHWFDGGHLGGAIWDRGVKRYIDAAIGEAVGAVPSAA